MSQLLYRVRSVSRQWRHIHALRDLSLEIRKGERVLLAGPSGSGKSTLLRMLIGGLRPSSGQIEVEGNDLGSMSLRQLRRYQARCGVIEQGSLLVPQLTVHRNVLAGRLAVQPWYQTLASVFWPIERAEVAERLRVLGLADRQWDVTANLSGGQQQRVAIARAMLSRPAIILADEPTASLDAMNAVHVTRMIMEYARDTGGTVLLCTHWVSLALPHVDRVVGIRDGEVCLDCPAGEVTDAALDEVYEGSLERL